MRKILSSIALSLVCTAPILWATPVHAFYGMAAGAAMNENAKIAAAMQQAISLEDYIQREKKCKRLGGSPRPEVIRINAKETVAVGLECKYNGQVFKIPAQQEKFHGRSAD